MEAFFVVVLAVGLLYVGVLALVVLRRMRNQMNPIESQES